jgi:hypothetical protein
LITQLRVRQRGVNVAKAVNEVTPAYPRVIPCQNVFWGEKDVVPASTGQFETFPIPVTGFVVETNLIKGECFAKIWFEVLATVE